MQLVNPMDWMGRVKLDGQATVLLTLLDDDVASAQLAYADYRQATQRLERGVAPGFPNEALREARHHAKTFVCAMRRVGLLGQTLSGSRNLFPPTVAPDIKRAWQRKKTFFDRYVEPRNAIEHLNEKIKGKMNWFLLALANAGLGNDELLVTGEAQHAAPVTDDALAAAVSLRDEIVQAVLEDGGAKAPA